MHVCVAHLTSNGGAAHLLSYQACKYTSAGKKTRGGSTKIFPNIKGRNFHFELPLRLKQTSLPKSVLPELKFATGVAAVALAFGPAVGADLQRRAVAQDGLGGERALAEQVPDHHRGALGQDQVEDAASFGARGVGEVASVQGAQVIGAQEAGVRFGLGPAVAAEPGGALPGAGSARCRA